MKKLYGILGVCILAIMMIVPVMAAPSPSATARDAGKNVSVAVADARISDLPAGTFAEVQNIVGNPGSLSGMGIDTSARLVAAFDLDMNMPTGETSLIVPITVENIKAGTYVVVICRAGDTWKIVGQGYIGKNLTINCTFTNFSTVAVLAVDGSRSNTGVKAPKTGQF
ncbi:MAG: hypothetical protein IKM28_00045 [Lachnospiraceae bacterium]|nr:hypothetical protein [Lachnospiraceae bacterium]